VQAEHAYNAGKGVAEHGSENAGKGVAEHSRSAIKCCVRPPQWPERRRAFGREPRTARGFVFTEEREPRGVASRRIGTCCALVLNLDADGVGVGEEREGEDELAHTAAHLPRGSTGCTSIHRARVGGWERGSEGTHIHK
jgi:hypothetical protein